MLAPVQYLSGLRRRAPRLHRTCGWLYVAAVATGGVSGLLLAPRAQGGLANAVSFAALIRQQYPNVDAAVMSQAYEGRAAVAQPRLGQLRERRFAPFVQEEGTD